MNPSMRISINGVITEEQLAVVSVYDHGFLYGIGLFETFRTYGGRAFLLDEHLHRMHIACQELGIDFTPSVLRTDERIAALLKANSLQNAYFRYTVTAGQQPLGLPSGNYDKPNEVIYIKTLPPRNERLYQEGKALQLLQLRRNTPEGRIRFKSLPYMNNILAKRELDTYPQTIHQPFPAEGIQLTEAGYLAEGLVSNLFFLNNGTWHTPSIETGIIPGITRSWVLRTLRDQGLHAREGLFVWEDLLTAQEVFITNSIQELVPITSLFGSDGQRLKVGEGTAGPYTLKLLDIYRQAAGNEGSEPAFES
jgi:4-amino-4-deoxychorismate lyase